MTDFIMTDTETIEYFAWNICQKIPCDVKIRESKREGVKKTSIIMRWENNVNFMVVLVLTSFSIGF